LKKYVKNGRKKDKNRNILKIKNSRGLTIIQPIIRLNSSVKNGKYEILKQKEKNANIDI
jgi:hypothetical protein